MHLLPKQYHSVKMSTGVNASSDDSDVKGRTYIR
jgi:hypothetical protein